MAEPNATDSVDTGLSDEIDTLSPADAEADLMAVDVTDEAEVPAEEDASDESANPSDEESEQDAEESVSPEDEQSEDEPEYQVDAAEEQRRRNHEFAQQRIREREERIAQKRQQQMEYLQEAEDDRDSALRQLQIDAYNNRIDFNSSKLETSLDRAVASIDLFRTGTPEVKDELASSLDDFERMYIRRDQNGDVIEVNGDLYQYLQQKAESIQRLTGLGARQETVARKSQRQRRDVVPSKSPPKPKSDPMLDAFDREAGI